jgi:hypothetical protein
MVDFGSECVKNSNTGLKEYNIPTIHLYVFQQYIYKNTWNFSQGKAYNWTDSNNMKINYGNFRISL